MHNNNDNNVDSNIKRSFSFFKEKKKTGIVIANITLAVLSLLLCSFVGVRSIDKESVFKDFSKQNCGAGVYHTTFDNKENELEVYDNLYKNVRIGQNEIISFEALDIDSKSIINSFGIVKTDDILLNGEITKLSDEDVYIPDYVYDYLLEDSSVYRRQYVMDEDGNQRSFPTNPSIEKDERVELREYYLPKKQNTTFDTSKISINKLEDYGYDYNLKVYQTDYSNYYPEETEDNRNNESYDDYVNYIDDYVNYVFVNDAMFTKLFDNFANIDKAKFASKEYQEYTYMFTSNDVDFYYGIRGSVEENSFTALNIDEFDMSESFAQEVLNIEYDHARDYLGQYFDITIDAAKEIKGLKYRSIPKSATTYKAVFLGYDYLKELHDKVDFASNSRLLHRKPVGLYKNEVISGEELNKYTFMNNADLNANLNKIDAVKNASNIALIATSIVSLIAFILYLIFNLIPEFKKDKESLNVSNGSLFVIEYTPRIIISLVVIGVSIGVGVLLINPMMELFLSLV